MTQHSKIGEGVEVIQSDCDAALALWQEMLAASPVVTADEGRALGRKFKQAFASYRQSLAREPATADVGREWPDIGTDPMQNTPYEDRMAVSAEAIRKAYTVQQPIVPNQTALVWRWHLMALLEAEIRLRSILSDDAAPSSEPAIAEGERVEWFVIRRHGAFFRPDAAGYTTHIGSAGFYTREQADKYADVEGVTIGKLTDWQAEALAVINGADRLRAALAITPPTTNDAIPAGMVRWDGGDRAPDDWDGGEVLCRDGTTWAHIHPRYWAQEGFTYDVVAYTPKASAAPSAPATEAGEGTTPTWRIVGKDSHFGPSVAIDGVLHDQVVLCFWRNQIQPIHLRLPGQAYVATLLQLMDEHQCREVAIIPVRHKERVSITRDALTAATPTDQVKDGKGGGA